MGQARESGEYGTFLNTYYYDSVDQRMRVDKTGIDHLDNVITSSTFTFYNPAKPTTTGNEWVYSSSDNTCFQTGPDFWTNWCFGDGASGTNFVKNVTVAEQEVSFYAGLNNGMEYLVDSQCLPINWAQTMSGRSIQFFDVTVVVDFTSAFDLPSICQTNAVRKNDHIKVVLVGSHNAGDTDLKCFQFKFEAPITLFEVSTQIEIQSGSLFQFGTASTPKLGGVARQSYLNILLSIFVAYDERYVWDFNLSSRHLVEHYGAGDLLVRVDIPSMNITRVDKALRKRLDISIQTRQMEVDRENNNYIYVQVARLTRMPRNHILPFAMPNTVPNAANLFLYIGGGESRETTKLDKDSSDWMTSYRNFTLEHDIDEMHKEYMVGYNQMRQEYAHMDSMEWSAPIERVNRTLADFSYELVAGRKVENHWSIQMEDKRLYNEPFDRANAMVIEFNDIEDHHRLLRTLFTFERLVNGTISIVGPCNLKLEVEMHLDMFLSANRVWEVEDGADICDYQDSSDHYGVITRLSLVSYKRYRLLHDLDKMQFSTSGWRKMYQPEMARNDNPICQNVGATICEMKDRGMMSSLHFVALGMTHTIFYNKMLVVLDDRFQFSSKWEELFLPLSSCTPQALVDPNNPNEVIESPGRMPIFGPRIDYRLKYMAANDVIEEVMQPTVYPKDYYPTILQFRSQIMSQLLRPSAFMRMLQSSFHREIWGQVADAKCIALHVRNGDKIRENPLIAMDGYMKAVEESPFSKTHRHIFLLSDNSTIMDDSYLSKFPYFTFHKLNLHRYTGIENAADIIIQGLADRFTSGMTVFSEVFLASQCDHFIGTMSSNIGRAIVELRIGRDPDLDERIWTSIDKSPWITLP
eukprot:gene15375-18237_t